MSQRIEGRPNVFYLIILKVEGHHGMTILDNNILVYVVIIMILKIMI